MRYRRKLDFKRFAQSSANQSNLVQLVTGMQEIKLNNSEKQQRWKWERIQVKLFKISIEGVALGQYQQIGSIFFSQTTGLFISFLSAKAVVEGNITLGMMMSISYIIGQLSGPIGQVIGFAQSLNIIVLEKGKVIEEGTHAALTAKRGAYYSLVKNKLELGL